MKRHKNGIFFTVQYVQRLSKEINCYFFTQPRNFFVGDDSKAKPHIHVSRDGRKTNQTQRSWNMITGFRAFLPARQNVRLPPLSGYLFARKKLAKQEQIYRAGNRAISALFSAWHLGDRPLSIFRIFVANGFDEICLLLSNLTFNFTSKCQLVLIRGEQFSTCKMSVSQQPLSPRKPSVFKRMLSFSLPFPDVNWMLPLSSSSD